MCSNYGPQVTQYTQRNIFIKRCTVGTQIMIPFCDESAKQQLIRQIIIFQQNFNSFILQYLTNKDYKNITKIISYNVGTTGLTPIDTPDVCCFRQEFTDL